MATYDFLGSIAQLYITFTTAITNQVVVGDNYYKVMLFIGHAEASSYFDTVPAIGTLTELTASTYSSIVTKGWLLNALAQFYSNNAITVIDAVVYDDTAATANTFPADAITALTTQFNKYHDRAYFKFMTYKGNIAANSALAVLCYGDKLLSQCWIDANDSGSLTAESTTDTYAICKAANTDPVIIYHPNDALSGVLTQLGLSLGALNVTGTPVANALDYISTSASTPSGTSGTNLAATDITTLTDKNEGFFITVGNGTGNVACKGGKTLKGNLAAAQWVANYIDYVCAVETATMLTDGNNRFKNNETYQCILNILKVNVNPFVAMGRFSDFAISAPTFANLPAAVGDMITIPNAWSATYNDTVRKTTVQGTLYVTQS